MLPVSSEVSHPVHNETLPILQTQLVQRVDDPQSILYIHHEQTKE